MFPILFSVFVFASAVASRPEFRCGSIPSKHEMNAARAVSRRLRAESRGLSTTNSTPSGPISVHFHVVHSASGEGTVSNEQIATQMGILNSDFKTLGVSFDLVNVTRTNNTVWYESASLYDDSLQTKMKSTLRQGNKATLNVFSVGFISSSANGLLGYSSFPVWLLDQGGLVDDGVVVNSQALPGGELSPYNLGRTLTHEVGHWFGLYHTFQDGCGGTDEVADTPNQQSPTFGCPTSRNSCPDLPGTDPFTNFLDYSDDSCMTTFTPGQRERAKEQMYLFRNVTL